MNAKSQQSSTSNQSGTSTSSPWSIQTPYLTQAFNDATGALNKAGGATIPTNFTAQYTPDQISAFQQMLGYGTGNMGIPGSSANAGATASGAAANGIANSSAALSGYNPGGNTDQNIANANKYVAGQDIPGQVKAGMNDANIEANYVTNPGIDAAAAASGNISSSRDAIAHGLVATNLANKAADMGTTLRANAYNTGLGLSEQQQEAQNTNKVAALTGGLYGNAIGLNAGTGANTGAVNNASGLFNIANGGIAGGYAANQAPLTNQAQQFDANTNDPFAALNNFYNIIGSHNWGNTTNSTQNGSSTTTYNPSTLSQIGAWTNFAGSLF